MKCYISILIIALAVNLTACSRSEDTVKSIFRSWFSSEPDILGKLKYQKSVTDAIFDQSEDTLSALLKVTDKDYLIKVSNGEYPENTEIAYKFLRDGENQIISITEFPPSGTNDWYVVLTHYFDEYGRTYAFQRRINIFKSSCTKGFNYAYEVKNEFYNSDFVLIGKEYSLRTGEYSLENTNCNFIYDYKVMASLDNYLEEKINNR